MAAESEQQRLRRVACLEQLSLPTQVASWVPPSSAAQVAELSGVEDVASKRGSRKEEQCE